MAEPVSLKYRAFISYSHADTSWAKWLHRALESFTIDKDLVGRETATGPTPKALCPIFRDRDDFTAARQALAIADRLAKAHRQCRLAARSFGLLQQGRRRAGGARQSRRGARSGSWWRTAPDWTAHSRRNSPNSLRYRKGPNPADCFRRKAENLAYRWVGGPYFPRTAVLTARSPNQDRLALLSQPNGLHRE